MHIFPTHTSKQYCLRYYSLAKIIRYPFSIFHFLVVFMINFDKYNSVFFLNVCVYQSQSRINSTSF